jgi:hypothetical protein
MWIERQPATQSAKESERSWIILDQYLRRKKIMKYHFDKSLFFAFRCPIWGIGGDPVHR